MGRMTSPSAREAPSLRRLNDFLYGTGVIVSILLVTTLITVAVSLIYLEKIDVQESEILRRINALAIAIQASPDLADGEATEAYRYVRSALSESSFMLTRRVALRSPTFVTEEAALAYRETIRKAAGIIRENRENIRRGASYLNLALLTLSTLGLLALLSAIRSSQRVTRRYLAGIERGIASLDELMQNKTAELPEFPGSSIMELDDLFSRIGRVSSLIQLDHSMGTLSGTGNMNLLLRQVSDMVKGFMPCDRASLAFIGSDSRVTAEAVLTDYSSLGIAPGYSEPLESSSLARVALTREPRVIEDLSAYADKRASSLSTRLLLREGIRSSLTVPLLFRDKCVGFIFISSKRPHAYSESHGRELARIASAVGHTIYTEYVIQATIAETTNAFVSLMSEKDNETSLHITRMSHYSYIIAREYSARIAQLDPSFIREILWFSPLHDIGKIGIPDALLRKNGPLLADERRAMERHVEIGERVMSVMDTRLSAILSRKNLHTALEIIVSHHEKFDGTGYPRKTSGADIPLSGRIVAVADVFDALTSKRPYKEAWTVPAALDWMREGMAGHFDPEVFSCLESGLSEILEVYEAYKEV